MLSLSIGFVKLGQPVPELNLSNDTNNGSPVEIETA